MSYSQNPHWIRQTGLLSVFLPEPPIAQKYRGAQRTDVEEQYNEWLSDAALDSLAHNGANLIWIRFFGGFGLQFEKNEMEGARDYMARAHSRGLKIAALVSLGALIPETLLLEEPECQNWLQVSAAGLHSTCVATQSFRARPCYNSENFLRYMERVCNQAVDFGADLIHFDEVGSNIEPDACHCPICVAAFRDFLYKQYGAQEAQTRIAGQERFGHNDFTHMRPPILTRDALAIQEQVAQINYFDTPHAQEWIFFKVHAVTQCLERLSRVIRQRNSDCAVGADLFRSFGENADWLRGIDFDRQLPLLDMARLVSIASDDDAPALDNARSEKVNILRARKHEKEAPGQLKLFTVEIAPSAVSQEKNSRSSSSHAVSNDAMRRASFFALARAMKTSRVFGLAFETALAPADIEVALGLNLMFNPTGLSGIGACLREPTTSASSATLRAYMDFYLRHKTLLLGAQSLASIAVFCDDANLTFDGAESRRDFNWLLSLLFKCNFGFELLYPSQLAELSRFRCVALPNCVSLTDETVSKFERFVSEGGGIIALKNIGERDHWRRLRLQPALAALLGNDYTRAFQREVSGGRVAFVPENAIDATDREQSRLTSPFSRAEVLAAIHFAAGEDLPLRVDCQDGSVLTEAAKTVGGDLILHAINLRLETERATRYSLSCVQAPQQVLPLSPYQNYEPLPFHWDNGRIFFEMNMLEQYMLFSLKS